MNVIDLPQRSPDWLRWRAGGVTASEAAVILGRSPHKTPWRLWAERTGLARAEDLTKNPFVQRGIQMEDYARQAFEHRHDTLVLPLCAEHRDYPRLRASFDGIDDAGCPVELKVPWRTTFAELVANDERSPTYQLYWVQVQAQLAVANAATGWLVFDPCVRGAPAIEYAIPRDDHFIDQTLIPGVLAFWDLLDKEKEPPTDPARDIFIPAGDDLLRWTGLAGQFRQAAAEKARLDALVKQQKAQLDVLEEAFVGMMGEFLLAETAGVKVLRYQKRGAIDYKAALMEIAPTPETAVEQYRRDTSDCVKVTVLKEEKATVPFDAAAVAATPQSAREAAVSQQDCYF